MNLAEKLKELVKNHDNSQSNIVYTILKQRVTKQLTLAAEDGNDTMLIRLEGDGEKYTILEKEV